MDPILLQISTAGSMHQWKATMSTVKGKETMVRKAITEVVMFVLTASYLAMATGDESPAVQSTSGYVTKDPVRVSAQQPTK